jgi:hypothetical protein
MSATYEQAAVDAVVTSLTVAQTKLRRLIADMQHEKATSASHDPELLRTVRKANADVGRTIEDLRALR